MTIFDALKVWSRCTAKTLTTIHGRSAVSQQDRGRSGLTSRFLNRIASPLRNSFVFGFIAIARLAMMGVNVREPTLAYTQRHD